MTERTTERRIDVAAPVPGTASGRALALDDALSLWGGLDPETGTIVDVHHPQRGECVTGRVLVMPSGRGSSSASSILVEAIRLGTAPTAIVLDEPDAILALGGLVGEELYGVITPVVVITAADRKGEITTGDHVSIDGDELRVRP